jgi:hypothetical protein
MEENQTEDDCAASAKLQEGLSWKRIRRIRELLCGGMEQGCAVYKYALSCIGVLGELVC